METHLDEVKEDVERLEELAPGRFKLIVTVAILVVTLATTCGAVIAARAAANTSIAQRARQVTSAQAVQDSVQAADTSGLLDQRNDDASEEGWRRTFADQIGSDPSTSAAVAAQMTTESAQAEKERKSIEATLPVPVSNLQTYEASLNVPTDVARQTANADAEASSQWEGSESSALADISMLALALFLLGLALTITHRPTAISFVGLAAVIVLVAVIRLGIVATNQVDVPTASAIKAFAQGNQDLATGDNDGALASFRQAVTISDSYEAAWEQLGYADFNRYTAAGFSASVKDYERALALQPAGASRAPLLQNLGYSQLVNGQVSEAGATLLEALRADPTNEVTLASLAEQATLAHDPSRGEGYLHQCLDIVQKHGPYFRNQFFQSFRSDQSIFYLAGVPTSLTDPFYLNVKEAEASLDSLGRPQPGDAHGASVTNIVARPTGKPGLATVGFDYSRFADGDHLAIRWYKDGVTYELTDSEPNLVIDPSWPDTGTFAPDHYVVPTVSGSQTIEFYLNGVLLGSTTFNMTG